MRKPNGNDFDKTRNVLESPAEKYFRPKRRTDVRTRVVEGETVVLDLREEFIHQFNKTASYIWEHCDGLYTSDEITYDLCQAFDVDYPAARKDVLATLAQFRQTKLLESS
jgi:coenzyme PQQ synthesis protein D (PqqD)